VKLTSNCQTCGAAMINNGEGWGHVAGEKGHDPVPSKFGTYVYPCDRCGDVHLVQFDEKDGDWYVCGPTGAGIRLATGEVFDNTFPIEHELGTYSEDDRFKAERAWGDRSVVHLAGNRIVVGQYAIQRCLFCGSILDEINASRMAVEEGEDSRPGMLVVGGLYEFHYRNDRSTGFALIRETESPTFSSDLDLPDNACLRLINDQ
jgi:hypothetical protein